MSVIGLPPRARCRRPLARLRAVAAVVKWRSSRRRSSAPDFQIAYSSESARALAEAAMMFVSLPIVDQVRVAVGRVDDDPGPRGRRRLAVEDAHLVVDEVDGVELRVERAERLAQRGVERVDRAVAVGRRVQHLAVDLDLDRRLGAQLAAVALLDEAGVVDDPERRDVAAAVAPDEELEGRLGALEREPVGLELLDELRQLARVDDALELVAELLGPERVFARPPSSETTSRPSLPTVAGSTCW